MYFGAELWREGKSQTPLLCPDPDYVSSSYLQMLTSEVTGEKEAKERDREKGRGRDGGKNHKEQERKWKGKLGKNLWYDKYRIGSKETGFHYV